MTRRARPVIAIDGPAGAGKSTASRRLAERLGYVLVDTGALYRAVALVALDRGRDWEDGPALGALTRHLDIHFEAGEGGEPHVLVEGQDRSHDIRTPDIARGASRVSAHPEVRDALLTVQRELGQEGGVVLEGRDIGTVVFPDAEVKIFLTASAEVRARRRVEDLEARGISASYEDTLQAIHERDQTDSTRPVAPLRPAEDAFVLDTSGMDLDAVVDRLEHLVKDRAGSPEGGPPGEDAQ